MSDTKSKMGGRRDGSGRKNLGMNRETFCVRILPSTREKAKVLMNHGVPMGELVEAAINSAFDDYGYELDSE